MGKSRENATTTTNPPLFVNVVCEWPPTLTNHHAQKVHPSATVFRNYHVPTVCNIMHRTHQKRLFPLDLVKECVANSAK